jgi:hypothetical protein
MNLIQIQDDLRQLPNTPQTLQLLAQYANGMNPTVPPYVALGELQARNQRMQQLAQKQQAAGAQQDQGTVNDQIQRQAATMTMQQQQQQAQQQQPQQQPQPPQAGIAGLPVQGNTANFGSGGIIAFKGAGAIDDAVEAAAKEADDDDDATAEDYSGDSKEVLAKLEAEAENMRRMKAPSPGESPEVARARLAKENPALFGSLVEPPGKNIESRLSDLQKALSGEYAKQREEAQKARPSLFEQLGQAAIGSRGQYGRSALATILGGYSSIANKEQQQQLEKEQALRMKELDLQQAKMDVLNKLDEARRAHAEGRFDDERKFQVEAAKIANTHNTTVANLLGKAITAAGSLAGRESSANIAAEAKIKAAKIAANRAAKTPTDQATGIGILAADLRAKHPDWTPEQIQAQALREYRLGLAPSSVGAGVKATSDAVEALGKFALLKPKEWKKYSAQFPSETEAKKAYIEDYKRDALPPELLPSAYPTKPAAAPAAPTAGGKVLTQADIAATAKSSGKSEAEVIAAAKAKGYTIQ